MTFSRGGNFNLGKIKKNVGVNVCINNASLFLKEKKFKV